MQVSVLTQAHCVSNTLLPVHSRIQYKLCMLMHDVYHGKQISVAAAVIDCVHPQEVILSSREPVFD